MFKNHSTRIVRHLVRWRYPYFLLLAAVLLVGWPISQQLSFDRSIENMFAPSDPLLVPFEQIRRIFGGDEVIVVAYDDPQLLEEEGLDRLQGLADELRTLPGIKQHGVISILEAPVNIRQEFEAAEPFLEMLENFAISEDRQTTAVVCMLKPEAQTLELGISRRQVLANIRKVARKHVAEPYVAGEPAMISDGFAAIEQDGIRLGRWTLGLLLVVILLLFRSIRWVVIPVAVVRITIVVTMAILVLLQFRLSMVSSMLTAIVTVTGVAMIIHVIVRYRDDRESGKPPREALLAAGGLVAVPVFWTCCTDAVGFGALTASSVGPVQSFGMMMAIGSLITCVVAAFFVPAAALWGRYESDPQQVWGERRLDAALKRLAQGLERRPRPLAFVSLAIVLTCTTGLPYLKIETDFTKNFRSDSKIVRSYLFVEDHLGGAGVWSIHLRMEGEPSAADDNGLDVPLTPKFLNRIRVLERRLRDEVVVEGADGKPERGLTKVMSLSDVLDSGEDALAKRLPAIARVLFSGNKLLNRKVQEVQESLPALYNSLVGKDPQNGEYYFRIMLRSREQQSKANKMAIIAKVRQICREEFPQQHAAGHQSVTGSFVLLAALIESLLADQWLTFGIAIVGIGLTMFLAFRSLPLALIALVPNALPIVMVLGLMGLFGFKINMGTVMIAAVSMGLSVDSSIHYLTTFRRAVTGGHTYREAIDLVHATTGRAMVFSTVALIAGFTTLTLSEFIPTIYFGVLVSLSMLGGVFGNLVLLPLLLGVVYARLAKTQPSDAAQDSVAANR